MTEYSYGSKYYALWREAAGDTWQDYVGHEFVRGLGDGSLPKQAFLNYLKQDYIFLLQFSRAWALGVVKSDSLDEMRTCAATVDALVNHEIQLHVQVCAAEGISQAELLETREELENLAYTRFVIEAGLSGDFLDLMAALAPCVFGYGEIGKQLNADHNAQTPYKQWIDTYAGDDYQEVCTTVAAMVENAVIMRLGPNAQDLPRWSALCERFCRATELEVGFWDMGLRL